MKLLRNDAGTNVRKVGGLLAVAMVGFAVLPAILVAREVYENVLEATTSIHS